MTNETNKLSGTVKRETEKAYLVDCETDTDRGLSHSSIWFPKSKSQPCTGGIEIEAWLYNAKANEMDAGFICFIELPENYQEKECQDCGKTFEKEEKIFDGMYLGGSVHSECAECNDARPSANQVACEVRHEALRYGTFGQYDS